MQPVSGAAPHGVGEGLGVDSALGVASPFHRLPAWKSYPSLFIHDACEELAKRHPKAAELAELHYFGNFTWTEAAALMDLPDRCLLYTSDAADE